MRKENAPPFELPEEPVDRLELAWFQYAFLSEQIFINKIRAVYFVSETYERVTGVARPGYADVVNEWFLWEDGRPEGRAEGFRPRNWYGVCDWRRSYATFEEARDGALAEWRHEVRVLQQKLALLERTRAGLIERSPDGG